MSAPGRFVLLANAQPAAVSRLRVEGGGGDCFGKALEVAEVEEGDDGEYGAGRARDAVMNQRLREALVEDAEADSGE